uniref:ORF025 n=1 Tax=Spodoptera frugiperda granulovirus TaxID=307454 RepID=A0A346QVU4_9BBAC|nr:ORF025 [Spodoptera frugiperda granulovirus]
MTDAYLINTIFNDILKFPWPVLLEVESLRLWYSLDSVLENFDINADVSESQCRPYTSFNVIAMLDDDNPIDLSVDDHSFVDLQTLRSLHAKQCTVMDDNLHTIIDQFVVNHLPWFVSKHLNNLKLITVFDVNDFAECLQSLEMINKYWLFRYKIVTIKQQVNEIKQEDKEEKESFNNNTIIDSLKNNLELQFKQLTTYPEHDRLRTLHSFIHLIKGTVGLLEQMLQWN